MSRSRTPVAVWFGGPWAVVSYHVTLWLLEHDPEHPWIRGLRRMASNGQGHFSA